jgi:hypothetical protein
MVSPRPLRRSRGWGAVSTEAPNGDIPVRRTFAAPMGRREALLVARRSIGAMFSVELWLHEWFRKGAS